MKITIAKGNDMIANNITNGIKSIAQKFNVETVEITDENLKQKINVSIDYDGIQKEVISGLIGMALSKFTKRK